MGTLNDIDPELPSLFIRQTILAPDPRWLKWPRGDFQKALDASARLVDVHGDRVKADINLGNVDTPYITWVLTTDASRTTQFLVPTTLQTRKCVRATVFSVRTFPQGHGTYDLQRRSYFDLMNCLTGVGETPVYDSQDNLVGTISQARWVDDHRISYDDEESEQTVVEYGIVVEIKYK